MELSRTKIFVLGLLFTCFSFGQARSALPLKIVIAAPNEAVKAGKPVYITVSLENLSDSPIDCSSFNVSGIDRRFRVSVRDENGKSMKRKEVHPSHMPGDFQPCTLGPGKSTVPRQMLISQFYNFTHPGEYRVQLSRVIGKDERGGIAKSNKITVTVVP